MVQSLLGLGQTARRRKRQLGYYLNANKSERVLVDIGGERSFSVFRMKRIQQLGAIHRVEPRPVEVWVGAVPPSLMVVIV